MQASDLLKHAVCLVRFGLHGLLVFLLSASLGRGAIFSARCRPSASCWPSPEDWQQLNLSVGGRLFTPASPVAPCRKDPSSASCSNVLHSFGTNPWWVQNQSGATLNTGYWSAWNSSLSEYGVAALTENDVEQVVVFANQHNLRLVIKATGHDYQGRSNAKDSLMLWLHDMRGIDFDPDFTPVGAPDNASTISVATVRAGMRFEEVYHEASVVRDLYVQGGHCVSVGVGGFSMGGGFGELSRQFGTGAANILEARVTLANGTSVTANAYQHQDLFWALRGGGGGTFGVVTSLTMRTYPLPTTIGTLVGSLQAPNRTSFQSLLVRFFNFVRDNIVNEHWGEAMTFRQSNRGFEIDLSLVYTGMDQAQARSIWAPFTAWVASPMNHITVEGGDGSLVFRDIPMKCYWNATCWGAPRPGVVRDPNSSRRWWWQVNQIETGEYLIDYASRWIPMSALATRKGALSHWVKLVMQLVDLNGITIHLQKGQANASQHALQLQAETSMHPAVQEAFGLAIMGANVPNIHPSLSSFAKLWNETMALLKLERLQSKVNLLRRSFPQSGTYFNEADYHEPQWQNSFWGKDIYARLRKIKAKVDPHDLFWCHHCVDSETF